MKGGRDLVRNGSSQVSKSAQSGKLDGKLDRDRLWLR
jgi:hypothetical protein